MTTKKNEDPKIDVEHDEAILAGVQAQEAAVEAAAEQEPQKDQIEDYADWVKQIHADAEGE